MTVMCAVCVILKKKPDWSSAKQLLNDPAFISKLINFDAESVTEKTYVKFKQYSKNEDFKPEIVGRVSRACESLCSWVLAVEKFHEVYRTVKPKEAKVHEANEALEVMRTGLAKKQKMLALIQGHLENFKKKYEESVNERRSLEERKELMKTRMNRATELTSALDTEKVRWASQYQELQKKANLIIGISLVSAGAVNYLGAMTQDYRTRLISEWLMECQRIGEWVKVDPSFDLSRDVVETHIVRSWIKQQLPDDLNSIENAIFLKYSLKWPLIIDPQNQVTRWIKEMEGGALKMCKNEDPLLLRSLEQAIRLGQPVLIEGVTEHLDPLLDSLLRKEIVNRGAQRIVRLGDVEVEYNESFRLYLVTSLPNPHYLPATFIKVNLINFTITFKCLFEQFLSLVVLKEQPELERERATLLEAISADFLTLRDLEETTLGILNSAEQREANLLDDQSLIDVLKQSKEKSTDILVRMLRNEETERNLNIVRQRYSAIATRASILFFSVQNLSSLNVMYQFSLSWFYNVFQSCLGETSRVSTPTNLGSLFMGQQALSMPVLQSNTPVQRVSSLGQRKSRLETAISRQLDVEAKAEFDGYIDSIIDSLTFTVYQVVSWALFVEHLLIFSFSLCVNILKHEECISNEKISSKGYNFFLNSALLADMQQDALSSKIQDIKDLSFASELLIDDKSLRQLLLLEQILPEKFERICNNMATNLEPLWIHFVKSKDPYKFMSEKG